MSGLFPSRFWLLVILSGLGSVGCLGYAGMQTTTTTTTTTGGNSSTVARQKADDIAGATTTTSLQLRNPISFVRDITAR